jgi:hypothetical protein
MAYNVEIDAGNEQLNNFMKKLFMNMYGQEMFKYNKNIMEDGDFEKQEQGRVYQIPVDESGKFSWGGKDTRRYLGEEGSYSSRRDIPEEFQRMDAVRRATYTPEDSLTVAGLDSLINLFKQPDTKDLSTRAHIRNLEDEDINMLGHGGWNLIEQLIKPTKKRFFGRKK